MRNRTWYSWLLPTSRTSARLPYVLALLVAGALVPEVCLAQGVFWRICEVYSNAEGTG